jgi:hypothetical protein
MKWRGHPRVTHIAAGASAEEQTGTEFCYGDLHCEWSEVKVIPFFNSTLLVQQRLIIQGEVSEFVL